MAIEGGRLVKVEGVAADNSKSLENQRAMAMSVAGSFATAALALFKEKLGLG